MSSEPMPRGWWRARTRPDGPYAAAVSPDLVVLLARGRRAQVERCAAAVAAGGDVEEVLDVLAEDGFRNLPDFAIAHRRGDGWRVCVRGSVPVYLAEDDRRQFPDRSSRPWSETHLGTSAVVLLGAAERAGLAADGPDGSADVALLHTAVGTVEWVGTGPAEPAAAGAAADDDEAPEAAPAPSAVPVPSVAPAAPPSPPPLVRAAEPRPEQGQSAPTNRSPFEPPPGARAAVVEAETVSPERSAPTGGQPDQAAAPSAPEDAGPGASEASAEITPTDATALAGDPVRSAPETGADPETEVNTEIVETGVPSAARTGLGLVCAQGHRNPPSAAFCRDCGAPLSTEGLREVELPVFSLRLPDGRTAEVDRPVIVGRHPRPTEDDPNYRAVRVTDPRREVSVSHLEVRPEGWTVSVRDLGSTNGTLIGRPGHSVERLTEGSPVSVEPGTEITLGESVVLQVEWLG